MPFQRCYCGICRKAGGGGGYLINLGGDSASLEVEGREHVRVYRARLGDDESRESEHQRHFCGRCGTHLWAFNPRWPELVHPVAAAIDSQLPMPTATRHMMVDSRASWVAIENASGSDQFAAQYPSTSLAQWHEDRELLY